MSQSNSTPLPRLCQDCKTYFGNPDHDNLCSVCFKKTSIAQKKLSVEEDPNVQEKAASVTAGEKLQQKIESEDMGGKTETEGGKQQPQKSIQIIKKPSKCQSCSKKVGMLGYQCRHCSEMFCKLHRLPEDHGCGVDFVSLGRKKLKMENPIIEKSKIDRI